MSADRDQWMDEIDDLLAKLAAAEAKVQIQEQSMNQGLAELRAGNIALRLERDAAVARAERAEAALKRRTDWTERAEKIVGLTAVIEQRNAAQAQVARLTTNCERLGLALRECITCHYEDWDDAVDRARSVLEEKL